MMPLPPPLPDIIDHDIVDDENPILLLALAVVSQRYNVPEPRPPRIAHGPEKLWIWRLRPELFQRQLGMSIGTFNKLLEFCQEHGLKGRYMSLEEKLAIFIYICQFGISQTVTAEIFGRSADTISKSFH